jgi:hypothetical protein
MKIEMQPFCRFLQPTKSCVPTAIRGKTKVNCRSKGKSKRQIASLPTHTAQRGRPVYPFTPTGVYFLFFVFIAESLAGVYPVDV